MLSAWSPGFFISITYHVITQSNHSNVGPVELDSEVRHKPELQIHALDDILYEDFDATGYVTFR